MERSEIGPGVFPWQSSYVLTIHITELLVYFINTIYAWRFRLRRIGIYDVPRCVRGAGVDFPFGGVRGSSDFPEFISTARLRSRELRRSPAEATSLAPARTDLESSHDR